MKDEGKMGKIASLCKRRGFVFPESEIYLPAALYSAQVGGGLAHQNLPNKR